MRLEAKKRREQRAGGRERKGRERKGREQRAWGREQSVTRRTNRVV